MNSDLIDHFQSGKIANIHGTSIFYTDKGEGEIILLVHGFFSSSFSFSQLSAILSKTNRVIAVDLPGIGFSETSSSVTSLRMMAKYLDGFIQFLSETPIHLVVFDYSGPISFMMLNDSSVKLKSLTAINTFINFRKRFSYLPLVLYRIPVLGNILSFLSFPIVLKLFYDLFLHSQKFLKQRFQNEYEILFSGKRKKASLAFMKNIDVSVYAKRDMETGIKKMVGFRQLIVSTDKQRIHPNQIEELKQIFRISAPVTIPGGHLVMEDQPLALAEKILSVVDASTRNKSKNVSFQFSKVPKDSHAKDILSPDETPTPNNPSVSSENSELEEGNP